VTTRKITADQEPVFRELRESGQSDRQIAEHFGCSTKCVRETALRLGYATRRTGRPKWRLFTEDQVANVLALWEEGKSVSKISDTMQTDREVIRRLLAEHNVKVEARHPRARGAAHGSWAGGRITDASGYVKVRIYRDDPLWAMANSGFYVAEHRLVMARHLGRPLAKSETVHHINGDKTDNRIENLQLRQGHHGTGVVAVCLDCGSHNIKTERI